MKRKGLQKLAFPLAVMFLFSVPAATAFATQFSTTLSGKNEVPRVKTTATGEVVFKFIGDHGEIALDYSLDVKNVKDATAARIQLGKPGKNGPVVVVLYAGPTKKGEFTGRLAHGRIVIKDLVGPLEGKTLGDLMHEIIEDNAYVNVLTVEHPDGEIRGPLKCPKAICPAPFWRK